MPMPTSLPLMGWPHKSIVVLVLGLFISHVSGSHFRYGTLSYEPKASYVGSKQEVEISFRAAYRRDYSWGSYAQESWAQTNGRAAPLESDFSTNPNINPQYDAPNPYTDDNNGNGISGERFYIRFPPFNGNLDSSLGQYVVQCPGPFYCDYADPNGNTDPAFYTEEWNPSKCAVVQNPMGPDYSAGADSCAGWHETYGMYLGDGTQQTVQLTVSEMEYSNCQLSYETCNQITGNYLLGEDRFAHFFETNTPTPFLNFFTGGQRVYECSFSTDTTHGEDGLDANGLCTGDPLRKLLNNNAEGRFRLEMELWLLGDGNRSPYATQIPVLPIARGASPADRRVFQVPAYDPDNDDLVFRFGDAHEFGGTGRSKMCQYPYSSNPFLPGIKDDQFNQNGDIHCTSQTRTVLNSGLCPTDRSPSNVIGVEEHSFTSTIPGLIEWSTFYDDGTPLPNGLYNLVVMIEDLPQNAESAALYDLPGHVTNFATANAKYSATPLTYKTKVPLDHMLYLYDGPLSFCNKACRDNKKIDTAASLLGETNGPADSTYPGLATFADKDGIYGYESIGTLGAYPTAGTVAPYTGMDAALRRYAQSCTVCGVGGDKPSNSSLCTPFANDGACGTLGLDGTSVVPTAGACVMNQRPTFTAEGKVGGLVLDNPGVAMWKAVDDSVLGLLPSELEDLNTIQYQVPQLQFYRGDQVEFYITAIDTDDCVELTLACTGLPTTAPFKEIGDQTIQGVTAEFGGSEILTDYPEFPQGMKVRRKFTWDAPAGSANWPEYDFRSDRTRVCFYAYDKYLFTTGPFYCIDILINDKPEIGEQVLVRFECKQLLTYEPVTQRYCFDDRVQKYCSKDTYEEYMWHHALYTINEEGVGRLVVDGEVQQLVTPVDPANFTRGVEDWPGGSTFTTAVYPTQCDSGHAGIEGPGPVANQCCTARIGQMCPQDTHLPFQGLIDETAIWNRELSDDEIAHTLFKMPQGLPGRQLEAPRGEQMDVEAGRILYSRWNSPCGAAAPAAPADTCAASPWKAHDVCFESTPYSRYSYNAAPWETPMVASVSADEGALPLDGGVPVTLTGVGFAKSPFMRCAMVPDDPSGTKDPSLPYLNPDYDPTLPPYGAHYPEAYDGSLLPTTHGKVFAPSSRFSYAGSSEVLYTVASALNMPDPAAPALHRHDAHHPSQSLNSIWSSEGSYTKDGMIPPYIDVSPDPASADRWFPGGTTPLGYASLETVTCVLPRAPFPSEQHYFGYSNDGGNMGTALKDVTYMDYAMDTSAGVEIPLGGDFTSATLAGDFTVAFWTYPQAATNENGTVIELGPGTGVYLSEGTYCALADGAEAVCAPPELLDMWHHMAFVKSGDTMTVFLNGNQVFSNAAGTMADSIKVGPTDISGMVDELKLYSASEEVNTDMMLKEGVKEGGPTPEMYVRFMPQPVPGTILNSVTGATTQAPALVVNPTSVPWEPTILYTVNGVEIGDISTVAAPLGENSTVDIIGFNLARSFDLRCAWGESAVVAEDYSGPAAPALEEPLATHVADGAAGRPRPDGKTSVLGGHPVVTVAGGAALVDHHSDTHVSCTAPGEGVEEPSASHFGLLTELSFTAVPFEYSNQALECMGAGYANGSLAVSWAQDYAAYSLSLWVMPKGELGGDVKDTTAVSFVGDEKIVVGYDGQQLFYYDSCVNKIEVEGAEHAAGEWHHVTVSVDAHDEAHLSIDGSAPVHFSTAARPHPAGTHLLCADLDSETEEPSDFFSGLVDEVALHSAAVPMEKLKATMFTAPPVQDLVSYQTFDAGVDNDDDDGVIRAIAAIGSAHELSDSAPALASAPWQPAKVSAVEADRTSASYLLRGTNFAPSPFLAVGTKSGDEGEVAWMPYSSVTGEGLLLTDVLDLDCGAAVLVTNAYLDGEVAAAWTEVAADIRPSVGHLAAHLLAHFTFDNAGMLDTMDTAEEGVFLDAGMGAMDMAVDATPAVAVVAPMIPAVGRDSAAETAVYLPAEGSIQLDLSDEMAAAVSAGGPLTICMWMLVELSDGADGVPFAGGWKLVTYVRTAEGDQTMYLNKGEPMAGEIAAAVLAVFEEMAASGTFVAPIPTTIDEAWVYARALSPCEIAARFYTANYALDLSVSDEPVTLALDMELPGVSMTAAAWVYPYTTEGVQTLLAFVDGEGEMPYSIGLVGGVLGVGMYRGCASFEPCNAYEHLHGPMLLANVWQHVTVAFDAAAASNATEVYFYVDGVYKGKATASAPVALSDLSQVTVMLGQEALAEGEHFMHYQPSDVRAFKGLVNSLTIGVEVPTPSAVYAAVQCPSKEVPEDVFYFGLNEGAKTTAGYGFVALPTAAMWTNTSYDDATDLETTFAGMQADMETNTLNSRFVIAAKTFCGKQRLSGGDGFTVEMAKEGWTGPASVLDSDDGNYHVMFPPAMMDGCGVYATEIKAADGASVASFDVSLVHAPTSAVGSVATFPAFAPGQSGTVEIQAYDAAGCPSGTAEDTFVVDVVGPTAASVLATFDAGSGLHKAQFTPQAGLYHFHVYLASGDAPDTVSNGLQCLQVSASCDAATARMLSEHTMVATDVYEANMTVQVMDSCGGLYTGQNPGLMVQSVVTTMGGEQLATNQVAEASTPICPDNVADLSLMEGSTFSHGLTVTKAGKHRLQFVVNGQAGQQYDLTVVPAVPGGFAVKSAPAEVVAGEAATYRVAIADRFGNEVTDMAAAAAAAFSLTFTLVAQPYTVVKTVAVAAEMFDGAAFDVSAVIGLPGDYLVDIVGDSEAGDSMVPTTLALKVTGKAWSPVVAAEGPVVFQHSAAWHGDACYVFGGALHNKSPTNDLYMLPAEGGTWAKVEAEGAPSPRYGHTAVVWDGAMYTYGGQRSLYAFGEVYAYDFAAGAWSYVSAGEGGPPARFDHSAVVTADGKMVIFGGRAGGSASAALGDMWVFDTETRQWTELATNAVPRYGHSAALAPGTSDMYVFGGHGPDGFSAELLKCSTETGECEDLSYGCGWPYAASSVVPVSPRFRHVSFADDMFVYIYGGSNNADLGYDTIFKFAYNECAWDELAVAGAGVGLYDHVGGLMPGGFFLHGGKEGGEYSGAMYTFPL